jgi:uncharacterized protein (TIGR02001 family)
MKTMIAASITLVAAWASPAAAQQALGSGFSVTGNGTVVSDYRFRGISQSEEDPALQGTLTLDHESGFYVGAFASTLRGSPRLGDVEMDLYAGYSRQIANGTDLDVGLLYYAYLQGDARLGATDYVEPYASVRHTLGPVTAEVGAAYAPEQDALGGDDNLYLFTNVRGGVPFTPVTVVGHLGHSNGGLAPGGDYLDWSLGLEVARGPATFALTYVDTDLPGVRNVDAGLLLSVRLGF